ncbi:MAG: hypothetical protein RIK87_00845 [Fuerstiella sp.]
MNSEQDNRTFERPDSDPEAKPAALPRAAVALILVLPFIVQASYLDSGFYYDDDFHLEQCARVGRGEISLWQYVTLPHGEHLIPVWKTMFFACWSAFGENSFAFHLFVTAFHATSALCLLALLRHYGSAHAAVFGSVLWAGAAIGGWDGPFLWLAASHLSVGVTFFLIAMLCVTQYHTSYHRRWALLMSLALAVSLLTMGSLIVLTPVLPLQFFLFEWRSRIELRKAVPWLWSWLLPCLVVGGLHLWWVAPAMQQLDRPAINLWAGLQMLGGGYAASSWNLLFFAGNAVTWGRVAGTGLLAILILRTDRRAQKLSLLFFSLSFCFSALAYLARSGWEVDHVLTWGRYRYLPTLFWCVTAGGVLDWLQRESGRGKAALVGFGTALAAVIFLVAQCRIASEAANVFRQIAAEPQHATAPEQKTQASTIDIDRNTPFRIQCG